MGFTGRWKGRRDYGFVFRKIVRLLRLYVIFMEGKRRVFSTVSRQETLDMKSIFIARKCANTHCNTAENVLRGTPTPSIQEDGTGLALMAVNGPCKGLEQWFYNSVSR